jgi:PTS system mannose-specific IIA component
MIGVVLAAHGEVAPALLKAAEAIVGPMEATKAITISSSGGPEQMRTTLAEAVREVNQGDGVLLLVDMFGGTPSNVCLATPCCTATEVVTGVNLPMLVKVATARLTASSLEEAAAQIASYGQRHINHASALMRERKRQAEEAAGSKIDRSAPMQGFAAAR